MSDEQHVQIVIFVSRTVGISCVETNKRDCSFNLHRKHRTRLRAQDLIAARGAVRDFPVFCKLLRRTKKMV